MTPISDSIKGDTVQIRYRGEMVTGTVYRVKKDGTRTVEIVNQDGEDQLFDIKPTHRASESREMKPTETEVNRLVKAYAGSLDQYSSVRAQQKAYDKFETLRSRLGNKYPDVDTNSSAFWNQLRSASLGYLQQKVFRGPGSTY